MADARPSGVNPLLVHSLRQFARARRKLGQRALGQWIILGAAAVAYGLSVWSWWQMERLRIVQAWLPYDRVTAVAALPFVARISPPSYATPR